MSRRVILMVLIALFSLAVMIPASAQGSIWYAEYYNNPTLSGTPALTRYENAIALNFGVNSPGSGINADGFSARFATDVSLNPGTYRFFLQADDNARVTFNYSQVVIDTFTNPAVGQTVSGDVTVTNAGVYHIQIDYREVDATAFVNFTYGNVANNPQPNFPVTNPPVTGGGSGGGVALTSPWTAQYYANTALTGDPAAILTVPTVNFNYANNQPIVSVPADNWSARFTSVQNLSGGQYTLRVNVDDGVRVFVNGALIINQFGGFTGQVYQAQLTLPAGSNNFQVEYIEFTGAAFLDLQLIPPAQVVPTTPPTTGAQAVVTAFRLNVRQAPDPLAARVTQISRNETYPVLGRNGDGSWYFLQVGNQQGWASSRFLTILNGTNIPVVNTTGSAQQQPPSQPSANTGIQVIASPYTVNIRTGPSTTSSRIGRLPSGETAALIGRNAANQWYQINYNGIVGWVTAQYAILNPANANLNSVPVTG
ncbi:MAG: PA14 domain-containing protein [bacterium]|nr:PA14 domain-containing protein [bacterium]